MEIVYLLVCGRCCVVVGLRLQRCTGTCSASVSAHGSLTHSRVVIQSGREISTRIKTQDTRHKRARHKTNYHKHTKHKLTK